MGYDYWEDIEFVNHLFFFWSSWTSRNGTYLDVSSLVGHLILMELQACWDSKRLKELHISFTYIFLFCFHLKRIFLLSSKRNTRALAEQAPSFDPRYMDKHSTLSFTSSPLLCWFSTYPCNKFCIGYLLGTLWAVIFL